MSIESPADVLDDLKRYKSPRRQKSLRILDEVCRLAIAHGCTDFSVRHIGRLSQKSGGPSAGTIRNPRGEPYRRLIRAHARAALPKRPGRMTRQPGGLAAQFSDPQQRAVVEALEGEVRNAKAEASEERNRANDLQRIVDRSAVITLRPSEALEATDATYGVEAALDLLPLEKESILKLLDPAWQRARKLKPDEFGRLFNAEGRDVLPIGSLDMLAKVAVALGLRDI